MTQLCKDLIINIMKDDVICMKVEALGENQFEQHVQNKKL